MKHVSVFKFLIFIFLLSSVTKLQAQVSVGTDSVPHSFSVLELYAKYKSGAFGGLRLPQLTEAQRDLITGLDEPESFGLMIYNLDINCVEFWNSEKWVPLCGECETAMDMSVDPPGKIICLLNAQGESVNGDSVILFHENGNGVIFVKWYVDGVLQNNEHDSIFAYHFPEGGSSTHLVYAMGENICHEYEMSNIDTVQIVAPPPTPHPENVQDSENQPFVPYMYIGAFWKANQTGERLIRYVRPTGDKATMADGGWTAVVLVGEEWITVDTVMTSDPNVGWRTDRIPNETLVANGNDPGFDDTYKVNNNVWVSGYMDANHPQIYFRIGLKSKFTDSPHYSPNPDFVNTFPARYGIIILRYKNDTYTQRIWIRQGEDADYVFRNGDPVTGIPSRTVCKRYSSYNTTAQYLNQAVDIQGAAPAVNPGKFTEYPTQAGAFFQWASDANKRFGWHPYIPNGSTGNWVTQGNDNYWAVASAEHETCPAGYHRPHDGPIDQQDNLSQISSLQQSEMRQSLYVNILPNKTPDTKNYNSYFGFYADGFFDRRAIKQPAGVNGYANSAVAVSSEKVAYMGQLFYNPNNWASVFFPAAGYREQGGGALYEAGKTGNYWSASKSNKTTVWTLYIQNYIQNDNTTTVHQEGKSAPPGYSIRCVKN